MILHLKVYFKYIFQFLTLLKTGLKTPSGYEWSYHVFEVGKIKFLADVDEHNITLILYLPHCTAFIKKNKLNLFR